jgi:hypothetical protein
MRRCAGATDISVQLAILTECVVAPLIAAMTRISGRTGSGFRLGAAPPAQERGGHASIEAPDRRDIGGEHDEPDRDHPEAENGQKSNKPAEDQRYAQTYADGPIARQVQRISAKSHLRQE